MVVAIQKSRHAVLIIAAVGIFRFVSELGRKFRITGVNPRNIARQYWPITAMPHRNREGKDFQETSEVSRGGKDKTAHDAVTGGRDVALLFISFVNHGDRRRASDCGRNRDQDCQTTDRSYQ